MKRVISSILLITLVFSLGANVQAKNDLTMNEKVFTDIPEKHWAIPNVNYLVSKGIINGFPDGTFKPNFNVGIDAFIKMTVTALGYTDIKNATPYWATNYIDKALELGLITENQFFKYKEPITREEMSSIIVKAIKDEKKADTRELVEDYVKDFSSTSYMYKEDVKDAYALGIITGLPDGSFQPGNYSTRAEASAIIHRMIDKEQRKPFEVKQEEPSVPDNDNTGSDDTNDNNNGAETDENNKTSTGLDPDTPIEYIHKVEDGKVVYSSEKIMKILKGHPLIPNRYSNDFEENNRICTDMQVERMEYTQASNEAEEFIETLFTRDYKSLDKKNYSKTLLYWLRAWLNYRDTDYKPEEFANLWANETEKWKVQQDMIFVTDSYRMILGNDENNPLVRGRMYFKFNNHENPDNIFREMDLAIDNLTFGKWYYIDVDVEMFRPMSNLKITWQTSKFMLHSFHYLSDVKLVEGQ